MEHAARTIKHLLLALTLVVFAAPAMAEDASTMDMYRKYEPHIVQQTPQYTPPTPYQQQYTVQHQGAAGFPAWLAGYKQRAASQGLAPSFLNSALADVQFLPRVIELDQKQPEKKQTFAQYRQNIVSDKRIRDGREKLAEYRSLLNRASQVYGVPQQYIVALWGIETNYGRITGGFDILSSLASLAYEGRRSEFFEKELTNALKILAGGHYGGGKLTGSWAGAMGQCQFMPSSYMRYAVDGDGDGNVDIWNNMADVFASMANYLRTEGWNRELRWGRAVVVPTSIPESAYGRDNMRPLSYWRQNGVKQPSGAPLASPSDGSDPMAALIAPDGKGTPTWLVYNNYKVIMHWNRSTYFATSVGLLADAIAGQ